MKISRVSSVTIHILTGSLLLVCLLFSNLAVRGQTMPTLKQQRATAFSIDPASLWVEAAGRNSTASSFIAPPVTPQSFNIQSAIDAAPNYSVLNVPRGNYSITDSIKVYGRRGLRIVCEGGGSYVGSWASGQTTFTWNGTDSTHPPMLEIINSGSITVEGCYFEAKNPDNSNYSNVGIDIDQRSSSTYGSGTTTDIRLDRLGIRRTDNSSAFVGVRISKDSLNNVEQIRMRGLSIFASGTGGGNPCTGYCDPFNTNRGTAIYIGPNANAKNITLTESYWTGAVNGVKMLGGSLHAYNNESHFALADYDIETTTETTTIEFHVSEFGVQFAKLGSGNFVLRNNGLNGTGYYGKSTTRPNGIPGIEATGTVQLLLEHNSWPIGDENCVALRETSSEHHSRLVSIGNMYPTSTPPEFDTFHFGYVSMMDNFQGRTTELKVGGRYSKLSLPQVEWMYGSAWAPQENGTMFYCSDCKRTDPCESGGSGAIAKKINNVWVCN